MKRFLTIVMAMSLATTTFAADTLSTPAEAEAMVKKAIAYLKEHGKEKAYTEFQNPKGAFRDRDLYVSVIDFQGNMLSHGANPKMVGKNLMDYKDPDGKLLVRERLEILKTRNSGWQDYKFVNPVSKVIETKTAYFEKVGELVITCGSYKGK